MKHKGILGTSRRSAEKHSPGTSLRYTKSELAKNFVQAMSGSGHLQGHPVKAALENLEQIWRPFMVSTRALGLFPFVSRNFHRVDCWWRNSWNFYSVVCLCCFVFNLGVIVKQKAVNGLHITVVDIDDYSQAAFLFHVIVSTSTLIYFLNSKTYLVDLFQVWASLRFEQATAEKLNGLLKRKIKYAIFLCALDAVGAVFGYGLGFYLLFQRNFNVLSYVLTIFSFWCETGDTVQTGLFCTLCCANSLILKGICHDLDAEISDGSASANLKWFKDMYMKVVRFVEVTNQLFGIYAGFLLSSCTIQACCCTYSFFSYGFDDYWFVPMLYWLVECWCVIIVICLSAGEVCEQTGRLYGIMVKMDASELPTCKQIQVLMMLDCFKNLDARITMFGIIPITKQTLPAIISVYLSYVFLLYQFPRGSEKFMEQV